MCNVPSQKAQNKNIAPQKKVLAGETCYFCDCILFCLPSRLFSINSEAVRVDPLQVNVLMLKIIKVAEL